jgi:hypothetical protein
MVYVIMRSAVQQRTRQTWWVRGLAFTTSSFIASSATGAGIGYLGGSVEAPARGVVSVALAVAVAAVGTRETTGTMQRLPQRARETSRRQLWVGALFRAAVHNGLSLGFGGGTRIGFAVWYFVPAGAFLLANPVLGALVYGAYGLTRGSAPWIIVAAVELRSFDIGRSLVSKRQQATVASGFATIASAFCIIASNV